MANGLMYPTGISSQPIDLVSGAGAMMRAAVESRLAEIEANKLEVDENYKNLLEAASIKTIKGLDEQLRQKYQGKIEEYREDLWKKFRDSDGKLTGQQKLEIQSGFDNLATQMQGDVSILEDIKTVQDEYYQNPDMFNDRALFSDLREVEEALHKGEYTGRPLTLLPKHQRAPSTGDFVYKYYSKGIDTLDKEAVGTLKNNIFTEKRRTGLSVEDEESLRKAEDFVVRVLEDPFFKRQYTGEDGQVDWGKYHEKAREVIDVISPQETSTKPYGGRYGGSGSSSFYRPYFSEKPYLVDIDTGNGSFEAKSHGSISTTRIPAFSFDGNKVAAAAIEYLPTAKSRDVYEDKIGAKYTENSWEKDADKPELHSLSENLIIGEDAIGEFSRNEYDLKPYVKVFKPKNKNTIFNAVEDLLALSPDKYVVTHVPLSDEEMRSALLGRVSQKEREGYEYAINRLDNYFGSGGGDVSDRVERIYTIDGEEYSEQELLDYYKKQDKYKGVSDEKLLEAIRKQFK